MSDTISAKITGFGDIAKRLKEMPQKIQNRALRKALTSAIDIVGKEVQVRCPEKTGLMKQNIGVKVKIDSREGGAAIVGFNDGPGEIPQGVLALWVEVGHEDRGHGKTKSKRKNLGTVAAHPFLRPALDATKTQAMDAFAESLTASLPTVVTP
jgi:HK97 gp10 family phage protein